jgi:hypothetical protein
MDYPCDGGQPLVVAPSSRRRPIFDAEDQVDGNKAVGPAMRNCLSTLKVDLFTATIVPE